MPLYKKKLLAERPTGETTYGRNDSPNKGESTHPLNKGETTQGETTRRNDPDSRNTRLTSPSGVKTKRKKERKRMRERRERGGREREREGGRGREGEGERERGREGERGGERGGRERETEKGETLESVQKERDYVQKIQRNTEYRKIKKKYPENFSTSIDVILTF